VRALTIERTFLIEAMFIELYSSVFSSTLDLVRKESRSVLVLREFQWTELICVGLAARSSFNQTVVVLVIEIGL